AFEEGLKEKELMNGGYKQLAEPVELTVEKKRPSLEVSLALATIYVFMDMKGLSMGECVLFHITCDEHLSLTRLCRFI
ncbi:Hypothetical predicted protein, partial [Paramuricea clavata]